MKLSIVIPVYNEFNSLKQTISDLIAVLGTLEYEYEIICVDDGSYDNTITVLESLHQTVDNLKVIHLSRNFGKEVALTAGIDIATGDALIPMDADGQHPPDLIPIMVDKWEQGHEVVLARRMNRTGEKLVMRLLKRWYYKLLNFTSEIPIPDDVGDFRLMDKSVVNVLKLLRERERFMKGLYAWLGFKSTVVEFEVNDRIDGQSKWGFFKLWRFALDGLTSFSVAPLKIWSYLGLLIFLSSLFYAFLTILQYFIFGIDVPGYASLILLILIFGGLQMIILGILGEYIGRIFIETKNRPLYIVKNIRDYKAK